MLLLQGTHKHVDPHTDTPVLRGRSDEPSVTYYRAQQDGTLYVYRAAQRAYGETLHVLCAPVTRAEIQEAINTRASYEDLREYTDVAVLAEVGLVLPYATEGA